MFELFIALFGGLFYSGKYAKEKNSMAAYDDKQRAWQSTFEYIKSRYVADIKTEQRVKDLISSGEHFDDICNWFADDFRYVFGENWRDELRIPPRPPVLNPKIYKDEAYSFSLPANHITWVYHLMLAKQGRIDSWAVTSGFPIGGLDDKNMCVRFAKCIESRLLNAGVRDIRLVFELDMIGTRRRTPSEICGGHIKIESLCHYPTYRLWC